MRDIVIALGLSLLLASCAKDNPVSPTSDTINSNNLRATFSISRESYGIHDTLTAATTIYNPGGDTVTVYVPVCWPISWYKVWNSNGTTVLSYSERHGYGCNSIGEYLIMPHQSQQISLLDLALPIADFDSTQGSQGRYMLKVADGLGTFSVGFAVN